MKKPSKHSMAAQLLKTDNKFATKAELVEQIAVLKQRLSTQEDRAIEAEKKLSLQGQLLATVSHELRTPMGAIINLAEILAEPDLGTGQQTYAETLKNSATSLLRILDDVLDHSRFASGKFELVCKNFSPKTIIDAAVKAHAIQCQNKGLALRLEVANDLPDQLHGDALRIRQILSNLISNAIKFTSSGTIDVSVSVAKPVADHVLLEISVKDTGIGLREGLQDHLFSPYTQADEQISGRYGGTGLGLSICRQLVLTMGGEIGYTSKVGKGAEFRFNVKCQPYQEIAENKSANQENLTDVLALNGQRHGHILIVEDNATNQFLISTYLEKFGHTFEVASSGKEAIKILQQQNFDAILMDVKMPDMGGVEATRLIRQSKGNTSSTPIIALTANAMRGDKEKYLHAGMDAYVSKPISAADLYHVIDRILADRQRMAS